ncbi:MAG: GerMN domain-containing protein [Treponema sp.]|nr:GerMN domain-containing protein [Treponema sp.]
MKIDLKKYIPFYVATVAAIGLLILSAGLYAKKGYGTKYVFIFPCVDEGKYVLETRYLKDNPNKDSISYFADELVLGSGLERTKYLFTPGTKVNSCFERNKTVYIDLSEDVIYMGHNVILIKDGIELLKTNIKKNFPHIDEVQVFVDGKYAFE